MHFIDNQTLHNPDLGPNNQFLCIETIPDSVMWPQSSVLLWRILTALYCTSDENKEAFKVWLDFVKRHPELKIWDTFIDESGETFFDTKLFTSICRFGHKCSI